ncbi:MAG TPA: hypothetical protein PKJ85_01855 [Nitrosomonas nitrosa]|nr:hypothetical protein [Nitrosomonas nitrosa]
MYHKYCNCGGNDCGTGRIIRAASEDVLQTTEQYILIFNVFVGFGLTRRRTERKVENTLCWQCGKTLQNFDGSPLILPEFDDLLPQDESGRWFGRLLEPNPTNPNLPMRYYNDPRYKGKYLLTLKGLDIVAKIENPEPFRKIGQMC